MKYVITGGPGTGKTTLIAKLKEHGFHTIDEVAREVLADLQDKGLRDKINCYDLQTRIYNLQINREQQLDKTGQDYFLDRGWIDNHAYLNHYLGSVPDYFKTAPVKQYDAIFILDRLPLVNDSVRLEDEQTAQALHDGLHTAYRNKGHEPIRVPVIGIDARLELILNHTKKRSTKQLLEVV